MAQLIQRSPLGLLSLLDSKAGGIAPNILSDTVIPTVDILDLYGLGKRNAVQASILAAAAIVGFNSLGGLALVPPGETWRMLNITGRVANVVAAGVWWAPGYVQIGAQFQATSMPVQTPTGRQGINGGLVDFWVPPGTAFGIHIQDTAIAADLLLWLNFERYSL
jgi:hypothetical protein